jgi:hypothetical protein
MRVKAKKQRTINLPCLTPEEWVQREIEPEDTLLGCLLSTTCRVLLSADTGSGKTMFAMGLAFAMALGVGFLHWAPRRKARVLYIDGEMPRDLLQERVQLACEWFRAKPQDAGRLFVLSTEDVEEMPPLDKHEGQQWLDDFIAEWGPFDFIIFDNIMSLCSGIMKEEESWQDIKGYILGLSKRRIGQLWLHHTGHDKSRAYGTKTREWQMDTVIVGEAIAKDHVGFNARFTKARRRNPKNIESFEDIYIELNDGRWHRSGAQQTATGRPNKSQDIAFQALLEAYSEVAEDVSEATWRKHAYALGISSSDKESSRRRAFQRAVEELVKSGRVVSRGKKYAVPDDND